MVPNEEKNKVWDIINNIAKDLPPEYKLIFGLLLVFLTSGIGSTIYGIIRHEAAALYLTFFSYVVAVISAIMVINKKASLDKEEIGRLKEDNNSKNNKIINLQNKLDEKRINMKLYLIGEPKSFDRKDTTYTYKYWIFNEETANRQESPSFEPRWEAGYLTIDIKDVGADDMIAARVENAQKDVWLCDYFHSRATKTEAKLLEK